MKIIQATFLWKNDQPGGIGVTFGAPGFTPDELTDMFTGHTVKRYLADSDRALGTRVVNDYLAQLTAIGQEKASGSPISLQHGLLAALNIIWLTDRGFIPNDEFNGYQFIKVKT